MTDEQHVKEWHLDRKVTLSLILALLLNAGSTVWWASKLDSRITSLEDKNAKYEIIPERLTRVETQVGGMREDLRDLGRKLDRVIESQ